jgi:hypothetical protein
MTERPHFARLKIFASNLNSAMPPISRPTAPKPNVESRSIAQPAASVLGDVARPEGQPPEKGRAEGKSLNGEVIHCYRNVTSPEGATAPLDPPFQGRAALKNPRPTVRRLDARQGLPPLHPATGNVPSPFPLLIVPPGHWRPGGTMGKIHFSQIALPGLPAKAYPFWHGR